MMNRLIPSAAVVAVLLAASGARASLPYPELIAREMPCVPQCTLCHTTNEGGLGPQNASRFGLTMKTVGMLPPLFGKPDEALNRLGTTDTDGDGATDIDEVHAGTNPSVAGAQDICGGPQYGCGARIAKQPERGSGLATALSVLTGLLLGALGLRRNTRRRSPR